MDHDDVPPDEMRRYRPSRDEIDAVLGADFVDDDLADVAAIVHDLRSAYLSDEHLTCHPVLTAFTDAPLDENGDPLVTAASNAHGSEFQTAGLPKREPTRRKRKMLSAVSAFVASLTGKVVLGTAVAAASVGGLHAANVVDVPGLPNQSTAIEQEVETTGEGSDVTDVEESIDTEEPTTTDALTEGAEANDGLATAEKAREKEAQAAEFSTAMEDWSTCTDDASAAHDASGEPGPLDLTDACGERPHPRDFGVTDPPADAAGNAADQGPEDTPAGPPIEDTPAGPPSDVPAGRP